jgi:hypothetical protein
MTTHHDLWIAARARMNLLEHELSARRRTTMPRPEQGLAEMRRAPRLGPSFFAASALRKASVLLLSLSHRLECYADRLLARARPQRLDESLNNPC